jgi:hypothetical protein
MYNENIMNIRRETLMAGVAGKSGRHKRTEAIEGLFLRLRSDVMKKVWSCKGTLEHQEGVSLSKAEAVERILEAGCKALAQPQTLSAQTPISTISEISNISLSEITALPDYGADVPGYGFPEDEEETLAPASHTNGQGAPASQPPTQPAIPLALEPAPRAAQPVDVPQASALKPEILDPAVKTPSRISEDIMKVAEARAQYERLAEREFTQLLFDRGIYRHRTKDGREVVIPHTTLRKWLQQAREAGTL